MQPLVNSRYQIVIPREARKKVKSLKPGRRVSVDPIDEETLIIKVAPKSWVDETYGMMKEIWKGIDTEAEHNKIAEEWEERLEELGRDIKR